jgi:hypothetical protein
MSDVRFAQKTEATISEQFRNSITKDLGAYTKDNTAVLAAALASTDKSTSTLPSLTIEDKSLKVVGEPTNSPQYFGSLQEITAFTGALAFSKNQYLGAALMVGAGGYQGYKDFGYLTQSETLLQRSKFTGALLTDASMISGGILTVAKVGPKWLAPTLMIGGFAGRVLLDLVPDRLGGVCK